MLANQSDFMAYAGALKSNYRKGVHRMEAILSNPTHAKEFAANLGGVSVVLGVPVDLPDRNSDKLLELLLGSTVADDAVETWLHQFYEFTGWDDLLSDSARCKEMANNPLIWRAVGGSKLAVGKSIATLAGLSCSAYKDIDAVAASSTAMAAVAASSTAMTAIIANSTALNAVVTSSTAMAAVAASSTAMTAIQKSPTALNAIAASSMATAKYAAGAAGLNPADYADMKAVAASSTAMTAVAASSTAMAAVVNSTTACRAIESSATAIAAMNAASGFVEVTNQVCQANSSMSVALINKKAWVSQYWNTSSDTNTSQSMLIGVNVVGGGSTNIGNFSVARTRKSVNKFVSSIRIATTYGSALSYGGIRYKPLS
nr:MAG TPA: Tail fiber protein [Caudoviricetes sp.]